MIEVIGLIGQQTQFEGYNQLFDYLIEMENRKLIAHYSDFKQMNWSFTIYSPKQVASLYAYNKIPAEAIREAFEDELPLIEIDTGSYSHPVYILNSPNVDLDYLKKKWCLDYCQTHNLILRNYLEITSSNIQRGEEGQSCLS